MESVGSRHPDGELLKVFIRSSEKEALKEAAAKENTNMSHLVRALILEWLSNQEGGS